MCVFKEIPRKPGRFNANCRSFPKMETKTIMFQQRFQERLRNNASEKLFLHRQGREHIKQEA